MGEYFIDLVLFFTLYSFLGWVLETIYASIPRKQFINRGFLFGPFCPIYGFGAILIIQSSIMLNNIFKTIYLSLAAKIFTAILLTTVLEYLTGFILEKIFKCKWWDYSNNFLNLHGRVCLQYSLIWGILSYVLIAIVHPFNTKYIGMLPISTKYLIGLFILVYFIFDVKKSIIEILDLKQVISMYHINPIEKTYRAIIKYRRIFLAFPKLYFLNIGKLNQEIRSLLHEKFEKIRIQIKNR